MKRLYFYMMMILLPFLIFSCSRDNFWGQFSTDPLIPSSISFIDVNPDEDYLTGDVIVGKASDESKIISYKLYWGSSATAKYSSSPIATLPADGTNKIFSLTHLNVPSGATHLLAITSNSSGDMTKYIAIDFEDLIVKMEKDIWTGASPNNSNPVWLTALNGKLYFFADLGNNTGIELRSYDPATGLVATAIDAFAGINNSGWVLTSSFAFVYKNWIYFLVTNGVNFKLYRFNGTVLQEITLDFGFSLTDPTSFCLDFIDDKLYFFAYNSGNLGIYNFDIANTSLSQITILPGTIALIPGKSNITLVDGYLYFSANDFGVPKFFQVRISPYNIFPLAAYSIDADVPDKSIVYNNNLYFSSNGDATFNKLWMMDCATFSLSLVSSLSNPFNFFTWNNYLYFIANDGVGNELYRTDGTTVDLIHDGSSPRINLNSANAFIPDPLTFEPNFKLYNNKIYMKANSNTNAIKKNELWVTDGISGGVTKMVKDFYPGGNGNVHIGSIYNNRLFMRATDDGTNYYLWFFDSEKMSVPLKIQTTTAILGLAPTPILFNGVTLGNKMFFTAQDAAYGRELWVLYYK